METEQTFTRGPILSTLLKFALPVLLALLLQAMYGAVDLRMPQAAMWMVRPRMLFEKQGWMCS